MLSWVVLPSTSRRELYFRGLFLITSTCYTKKKDVQAKEGRGQRKTGRTGRRAKGGFSEGESVLIFYDP